MFYCCGALFFCVTTLVAVCKKEKDTTLEDDHVKLDVIQTYSLLWDVLKLRSVQLLGMALLTSKVNKNKSNTYLKCDMFYAVNFEILSTGTSRSKQITNILTVSIRFKSQKKKINYVKSC